MANMFPQQPKHSPTATAPGPSLGNSLLNISLNNGGILGNGVLLSAHAGVV
jgi:hypothetical protein